MSPELGAKIKALRNRAAALAQSDSEVELAEAVRLEAEADRLDPESDYNLNPPVLDGWKRVRTVKQCRGSLQYKAWVEGAWVDCKFPTVWVYFFPVIRKVSK